MMSIKKIRIKYILLVLLLIFAVVFLLTPFFSVAQGGSSTVENSSFSVSSETSFSTSGCYAVALEGNGLNNLSLEFQNQNKNIEIASFEEAKDEPNQKVISDLLFPQNSEFKIVSQSEFEQNFTLYCIKIFEESEQLSAFEIFMRWLGGESNAQSDKFEIPGVNVRSRLEWSGSVDDFLGINPEDYLYWPEEYYPLKMFFVHHTAGTPGDNPDATVRAIFEYHARVREWGDIGYNFLIDQNGQVYEGRRGGLWIEAGHVYGFNKGSIGIGLIGNFEGSKVPEAQLNSLKSLISGLSNKFGLDPNQVIEWQGKEFRILSGHKDGQSTSCPGDNLYSLLPQIREEISNNSNQKAFTKTVTGLEIEAFGNKSITVSVENRSSETWVKGSGTEVFLSPEIHNLRTEGTFLSAEFTQNENSIPSGQSATFTVNIIGAGKIGVQTLTMNLKSRSGEKYLMNTLEIAKVTVKKPIAELISVTFNPQKDGYLPGEVVDVSVRYRNTNSEALNQNVKLGTWNPQDSESEFFHENWISKNRASELTYNASPDGFIDFGFQITVPDLPSYAQDFLPVLENVSWFDEGRTGTAKVSIPNIISTKGSTENGLSAFYYSDNIFGNHFATATNEPLSHTWSFTKPPHPLLKNQKFSARFFGFLKFPEAGNYRITMNTGEGVMVFVDGELLLSSHSGNFGVEKYFDSGPHKILVEYSSLEKTEGKIQLFWETPSGEQKELSKEDFIPYSNIEKSTLSKYFYEGPNFSYPYGATRKDSTPNLKKTIYPQHIFSGPDNFTVQEIFYFYAPEDGNYEFMIEADDGVKLWIDDPLVINWEGAYKGSPIVASQTLSSGFHLITLNYKELGGESFLDFKVRFPRESDFKEMPTENIFWLNFESDPLMKKGFLSCIYQDNPNEGKLINRRYCQTWNEGTNWGLGSPNGLNPDFFSVKMKGVTEISGNQKISFGADDGMRIYNDNGAIFDEFFPSSFLEKNLNLDFANSGTNLEFDYFEETGDARLEINLPGQVWSR